MLDFTIDKDPPFYTLTLMKDVNKRNGEVKREPGDKHYSCTLDYIKDIVSYNEVIALFKDKNISLKDYLIEYNKCYNQVCELLKKTL